MPSSPSTTPARCTAGARRASGCGSSAAPTSTTSSDPDLLQPPLDRSFKKPGGYVMRDKLAAAREQSGTSEAEGRGHGADRRPRRGVAGARRRTSRAPADRRDRVPATRTPSLLLLAMADDEFVIGFADSEWTGIAPMLEEDVAMSSLAQDELGHAQALYSCSPSSSTTAATPTRSPTTARPTGYRHARLLDHGRGDWADDDRPPLPVRHRRRGPARGARVVAYAAAARAGRQDPARGALPP